MQEIEHSHTHDLHWNVRGLKTGGDAELSVELCARILNRGGERTGGTDAGGRRYLGNHRIARSILNHQVVVGIAFQFENRKRGVDHPNRGLRRGDTIVGRDRTGSGEGPHRRNRGIRGRVEVDFARIRIGAGFYRLALNAALRQQARRKNDKGGNERQEETAVAQHIQTLQFRYLVVQDRTQNRNGC